MDEEKGKKYVCKTCGACFDDVSAQCCGPVEEKKGEEKKEEESSGSSGGGCCQ